MRAHSVNLPDGETIFVGIDMHQRQWRITIRTIEVELLSASIPGDWQSLRHSLERYYGHPIEVVYEAGCFGYWLRDRLVEFGAQCIVTPPSLIPQESGNRVKTDKRDSRKLALLLAKGMLKQAYLSEYFRPARLAFARKVSFSFFVVERLVPSAAGGLGISTNHSRGVSSTGPPESDSTEAPAASGSRGCISSCMEARAASDKARQKAPKVARNILPLLMGNIGSPFGQVL